MCSCGKTEHLLWSRVGLSCEKQFTGFSFSHTKGFSFVNKFCVLPTIATTRPQRFTQQKHPLATLLGEVFLHISTLPIITRKNEKGLV